MTIIFTSSSNLVWRQIVKSLSSLVIAAVTVGVVPYLMLLYILRPYILSFYHFDISPKQGSSYKLEEELFAKADWIIPS